MDAPRWLTRSQADVPAGDAWLGPRERRVLAGLRIAQRRDAWRLGRWTAKARGGRVLALPPSAIEVLAAPDGAPEVVGRRRARAALSLSLSHRAGRALAVVGRAPAVVGCDLEVVEPRSGAFVREWLAPAEQALVAGLADGARDRPSTRSGQRRRRSRRFVARACGSTYATPWSTLAPAAPDGGRCVFAGMVTRPPAGGGRSRAG